MGLVCVGRSLWSGFLVSGGACEGFFFGRFLPSLCGLRVGIFGSLLGGLSFSTDLSCLFGAMGGLRCVLGAQEF